MKGCCAAQQNFRSAFEVTVLYICWQKFNFRILNPSFLKLGLVFVTVQSLKLQENTDLHTGRPQLVSRYEYWISERKGSFQNICKNWSFHRFFFLIKKKLHKKIFHWNLLHYQSHVWVQHTYPGRHLTLCHSRLKLKLGTMSPVVIWHLHACTDKWCVSVFVCVCVSMNSTPQTKMDARTCLRWWSCKLTITAVLHTRTHTLLFVCLFFVIKQGRWMQRFFHSSLPFIHINKYVTNSSTLLTINSLLNNY